MDIFSLPVLVLHELMKWMDIRDRLSLRLTCRTLERLVANTDAGAFKSGNIQYFQENGTLTVRIGNHRISNIDSTDDGVQRYLILRNLLFKSISIGDFGITADKRSLVFNYILQLTDSFKIGRLNFTVGSKAALTKSVELLTDHPEAECTMNLWHLPESETLLTLPPIETLRIRILPQTYASRMCSELFLKLILAHKNITLGNWIEVSITPEDWMKIVQDLSADSRQRQILFKVQSYTLAACFRSFGLNETFKTGDCRREFEVIHVSDSQDNMTLRYRKCLIEVNGHLWSSGMNKIGIEISNCEE